MVLLGAPPSRRMTDVQAIEHEWHDGGPRGRGATNDWSLDQHHAAVDVMLLLRIIFLITIPVVIHLVPLRSQ